jgi:hypothetical protein
MAHLGNQKFWKDFNSGSLDADDTCSALHAVMCRENITHLVSVSPQYRLNWCADKGSTPSRSAQTNGDDPRLISFGFPLTIPTADRPVSLDTRIGAFISGSTTSMTVRARIVWDVFPPEISTAAGNQDALMEATGSTSSTTGAWVIDDQTAITNDYSYLAAWRRFTTDDEGTERQARLALARLDCVIDGTYSGSGSSILVAAQVREYV